MVLRPADAFRRTTPVGALKRCTKTNDDDSGEIVVLPIEDMIRIRTGEHLARAA